MVLTVKSSRLSKSAIQLSRTRLRRKPPSPRTPRRRCRMRRDALMSGVEKSTSTAVPRMPDHVARGLFTRQHESVHRDAEEQHRDQAHQDEERQAGAHEEAVGGDEARDSPSRGGGHNWRKKWARSPPFTSNRRILLSRIT